MFHFHWGGRSREISGDLDYEITKMEVTLEGHSVHSSLPKPGLSLPQQNSKRILLKDSSAFSLTNHDTKNVSGPIICFPIVTSNSIGKLDIVFCNTSVESLGN